MLRTYLNRVSGTKTLGLLLAGMLLFVLVLFRSIPGLETLYLDTSFGYDRAWIMALFQELGPDGRQAYVWASAVLDGLFPLVYGSFFAGLLYRLRLSDRLWWFALLPLAAVLVDYAENIQVIRLLTAYPGIGGDEVALASATTRLKWMVVDLMYGLTVLSVAAALARRFTQRKPD